MTTRYGEFLLDLANVLEKHKVCITSPFNSKDEDEEIFRHVGFQTNYTRDSDMFPNLRRCSVSAYDLRCEAGMSSGEANDLYHLNSRITGD